MIFCDVTFRVLCYISIFGAEKSSKLLTRLLRFDTSSVFIIFISKNNVFTESKE